MHFQLGEPPKIRCGDARGEQKPDRFREEPPCHKRERPCRHLIEPFCVVDNAEQRTLLSRLREQGEERQPDEEPIRRRPFAQAERDLEGVALWWREALDRFEQRRTQLVQGGERQLHLGLDARSAKEPHVRGRFRGVVQKRCLPDPGFAAKDQHAALAGTDGTDHVIEQRAFHSASAQARGSHGDKAGHGSTDPRSRPGIRPGIYTGAKRRARRQTRGTQATRPT